MGVDFDSDSGSSVTAGFDGSGIGKVIASEVGRVMRTST